MIKTLIEIEIYIYNSHETLMLNINTLLNNIAKVRRAENIASDN